MSTNSVSKPQSPVLQITPERALVDQPLAIQVNGLEPGQVIQVVARTKTASEQVMVAAATFAAGPDGVVDLGKQKPLAGSYDWVDPMGLVWTMKPEINPNKPQRPAAFSLSPMEINYQVLAGDSVVAEKTVQRIWMVDGAERIVLHENGLRGILIMPPGEGPFPSIIIVSGSGGGLDETRAAQYAAHGYAALALAYFAYQDLPKDLYEIPLEYFESAIHWLQANPKIDGSRIAFTGQSRGGELSLVLSSRVPDIKAVIAYVPSFVSWGGVGAGGNPDVPAWTFRGKPVTYITHKPSESVVIKDPNQPIPLTSVFLEALEKKEEALAATTPVENIQGAVLLISGDDDQMWPSTFFSQKVMERLDQHHFKYPYQHLHYPGTGHAIRTPYYPLTPSHALHPVDGRDYAYGGNPQGQSFAHKDSWDKILAFLEKNL